jgi:hypothetical protein
MFYVVGSLAMPRYAAERFSYGFAPATHGEAFGLGNVRKDDEENYAKPYYCRTLEITQSHYDVLRSFGLDPSKHGFSMQYNGVNNS